MEKKPAQKYSSLLGPVDDVVETRPRTSSNASQARHAQRYESMLSPADAPVASNTASPRYSSIMNPENNLLAATGPDAPPPYQPAQPTPSRRSPSPPLVMTPDDDVGPDSDELVPPDMLVLAGTEIYGTKTPHAPPIYRLNLAIGHLRESNMTVSFSRLDYRGHAGAAHAPRERHSNVTPEFFFNRIGLCRESLESVSRVVCLATWGLRAATASTPKTDS
jgi:hypothetical protein